MQKSVFPPQFLATAVRCGLVGILCSASMAFAQAPATVPPAQSGGTVLSVPAWDGLTPLQRESLKPLASTWNSLTDAHKRKWLALAQTFPRLSSPEQSKMHARMAEWAALKPKEREQARLNFAETKKIAPTDRAANWEAYQALPPEERKALASKAKKKPPSAALAVKPVGPEKLAAVPVTRLTPEPVRERLSAKQAIDRNTLLPILPRPAPKLTTTPPPTSATN